ncbi:hypothetical protein DL93DRAFT_1921461 [Clavulina sp. PMI_390]|nr:hypothetical protein DL93DRAFT_1921461 [Clavulina sp. PMI_390]
MRCDGGRPQCGRCIRSNIACEYAPLVPRRSHLQLLEQRAGDLQHQINVLSAQYNTQLVSRGLMTKIEALGQEPLRIIINMLPIYPELERVELRAVPGQIAKEESESGYLPAVARSAVSDIFGSFEPSNTHISDALSLHLIRIFMPHRFRSHFYVDSNYFFDRFFRPPSDPRSFQPGFLYAIYAAARFYAGTGSENSILQSSASHFAYIARTKLNGALANAERFVDFLYGSVILASYLININNLNEAYVMHSATVRFALACGLDGVLPTVDTEPVFQGGASPSSPNTTTFTLLSPPADELETVHRVYLSRAVYSLDRVLTMVGGFPSAFARNPGKSIDWLSAVSAYGHGSSPMSSPRSTVGVRDQGTRDDELPTAEDLALEISEMHLSAHPAWIKVMLVHERVARLAEEIQSQQRHHLRDHDSSAPSRTTGPQLVSALASNSSQNLSTAPTTLIDPLEAITALVLPFSALEQSLPAPFEPDCIQPGEIYAVTNPHLIETLTTYQGTIMMLYGLIAGEDSDSGKEAREKMMLAAKKVAQTFRWLRTGGLKPVHAFVMTLPHTMNAARILSAYIRQPSIRSQSGAFASIAEGLGEIVLYLQEMVVWFPAWRHVLPMLREFLPTDSDLGLAGGP